MWKLSTSARSLPGEPCFLGFFWNFFFFPFFIGLPRGLYELLSISTALLRTRNGNFARGSFAETQ
jgi:hypothetical protein